MYKFGKIYKKIAKVLIVPALLTTYLLYSNTKMKNLQIRPKTFAVDFQVHPLENRLIDIVKEMQRKKLNAIAAMGYNREIFPNLLEKTNDAELNREYKVEINDLFIKFTDIFGKDRGEQLYMLKGTEISTSENFDLLAVGYEGEIKPYQSLEESVREKKSKNGIIIFDHPFVNPKNPQKSIDKQQKRKLEEIAKDGEINGWEWNAYCIPWIRKVLFDRDVNKELEEFAAKLESKGYFMRIIPTSDTHARNKRLLDGIGTSYVSFSYDNLDFSSSKALISSLKENIKEGRYIGHKQYVSELHFIRAFGIPYLFNLKGNRG